MKSNKQLISENLYRSVRKVIESAHKFVSIAANAALVKQNWEIGRLIVEDEQKGARKAEYGKAQIDGLANRLTLEYGNGYDSRNLRYMRSFYLAFPIWNAVRSELNWTQYRILMRENDPIGREWYMNECVACGWSSRELDRQVSTQAYSRLLASVNPDRRKKRKELPLTKLPTKPKSLVPADFIKNPMMLEFLSLPDDVKIRETKLESAIISHLKEVLMELGRGFCFVARQKRMIIDGEDFKLDLLFYHRRLHRLIAIDLKKGRFKAEYKGQMELYLRWLEQNEMEPGEESPLGLLLCTEGSEEQIELLQLDKAGIKVAKYLTELPPREVLQRQVQKSLEIAKARFENMIEEDGE